VAKYSLHKCTCLQKLQAHLFGKTKIRYFDVPQVVEQHVFWLHITIGQLQGVKVLEKGNHLCSGCQKIKSFGRRKEKRLEREEDKGKWSDIKIK